MHEPDEFTRQQSEEAIRLYTAYRYALDHSELGGQFMPYRWWTLPDPISGAWMPYVSMLGDYACELANIINDLTHDVQRLRAWARVTASLGDEEKLAVSHEFIDTLGTVALKASLRDVALKPAARGDQAPTRSIGDPIPVHRAARAIGGGFKPWGMIIDHMLSGATPFTMSDARASRIQISARDAHSLHSLDLSLTTPSTLLPTCSQRDALEILNLPGKHSHLLKQFAEADDQWEMDWDLVLRLARTRITLTELSASSGIRAPKLETLLEEEGCPRADPLGWWREEALDALRRVAAVAAALPR